MPVLETKGRAGAALCVVVAVLAGCKEQKPDAAVTATDRVRQAVEQSIRGSAAAGAQGNFRGEQVYAQAIPQRMAVCGQVSPFADDRAMFVPFVTVVTLPDAGAKEYKFEHHIATTTSEASRVYLMIVNYCYDKGGPAAGPSPGVMQMAPLPDSIPDPAARASAAPATPDAPAPAPKPAGQVAASGTVTMRQNGNLHADPHGPSTRVVPQGTSLKVFAQSSGGWYQVGDSAPWGWVHESMLDKR